MGGSTGWRPQVTGEDWMRNIEKRVLSEERRPVLRSASDFLGPGFGPTAILTMDWNSDETAFNGFFYSQPNRVIHSPDNTKAWAGLVVAEAGDFGVQKIWNYRPGDEEMNEPIEEWVRRFFDPGGGTRSYSDWMPNHPTQSELTSTVASPNGIVQRCKVIDIRSGLVTMNWRVTWTGATQTGTASGNIADVVLLNNIAEEFRPSEQVYGVYQVGAVTFGTYSINSDGVLELHTLHATGQIASGDNVSGTITYSQLF